DWASCRTLPLTSAHPSTSPSMRYSPRCSSMTRANCKPRPSSAAACASKNGFHPRRSREDTSPLQNYRDCLQNGLCEGGGKVGIAEVRLRGDQQTDLSHPEATTVIGIGPPFERVLYKKTR